MDMKFPATYVSVWDEGTVSFESKCTVDLASMDIVEMGPLLAVWDEDGVRISDENEIDIITNNLGLIFEEYVELADGSRFTAAPADEYIETADKYGRGIVTYKAK